MSHLYLAPYVGAGTPRDPFQPRGWEQGTWASISLRPDPRLAQGRALMLVPVRDDTIGEYLGGNLDEVSAVVKSLVERRLGLTLQETATKRMIAELLMVHGREDGTRWRPLRPTRAGIYEVRLGSLIWAAKTLAGGTTITESFNTADGDILGPDLSWTEFRGDIDIVSNEAKSITTAAWCAARADTDLATDDHYAQAVVTGSAGTNTGGNAAGCLVRKDSTATLTYYNGDVRIDGDSVRILEWTAGTGVVIASSAMTLNPSTAYSVKVQVNGSSLEVFVDGVSKVTTTDTTITGNLRTGITAIAAAGDFFTWDSFEAGDLIAVVAQKWTQDNHYHRTNS